MTKKEFIKAVAGLMEVTNAEAERSIDTVGAVIFGAMMRNEDIRLPFLGTFRLTETKARKGRNPQTGETINIPAKKRITFKTTKGKE